MTIYRYCCRCGGNLVSEGIHGRCTRCQLPTYVNPKPTASTLIIDENKVLLTRRASDPKRGFWDLPGGFLNPDEHPEEAVKREVKEELGVEVKLGPLLTIITDRYGVATEEYGQEGAPTLNFYYEAEIVSGELRPADDVDQIKWFPLNQLPKMAFNCDRQAIQEWFKQHPVH